MSADRTTVVEHVSDDGKTVVDAEPFGRAAHDRHQGQERTLLLSDEGQSPPLDVRGELERTGILSMRALEPFSGFPSVPLGLVVGSGLGLIVVLVLGFWVYRERQISNALRAAIELAEARAGANAAVGRAPSASSSSEALDTDMLAAAEVSQAEREQIERRGADLLFANDYRAALDHYERLWAAFPSDAVLANMVRVLRWRLRCLANKPSRGPPCR